MSFYIELRKAKNILRYADGTPYSWVVGEIVEKFDDPVIFDIYVEQHIGELVNVTAVSGSASMMARANAYLLENLKKAGLAT